MVVPLWCLDLSFTLNPLIQPEIQLIQPGIQLIDQLGAVLATRGNQPAFLICTLVE
ncbi:MAG: hypothetical protein AB4426_07805 [Xenococcaceae cyanobacterium]